MSASENTGGRVTASVNSLAGEIVDRLVAGAERYRVRRLAGSLGELLIDAGAKVAGGIDAGLLLTEICMGGLGKVTLSHAPGAAKWPFWLTVASNDPGRRLPRQPICRLEPVNMRNSSRWAPAPAAPRRASRSCSRSCPTRIRPTA